MTETTDLGMAGAAASVPSETVYSLSEIEAHARKAVRGAGFAWGYAEEAAKLVRLLSAYQRPGAVVLAAYLQARMGCSGQYSAPVMTGTTGSGESDTVALCPLLSGAYLCDNVQSWLDSDNGLVLENLAYPLLVVPYLILLGRRRGLSLRIVWDEVDLVCSEGRLQQLVGEGGSLAVAQVKRFSCEVAAAASDGDEAGKLGQVISDDVWQALHQFAQCTYVPATEASRRGAGPAD